VAGRTANKVETVWVRISTTPKVKKYLDVLTTMELYGKTAPEVAERFISERIQDLIADGTLKRK
jgi:hypothetical protein